MAEGRDLKPLKYWFESNQKHGRVTARLKRKRRLAEYRKSALYPCNIMDSVTVYETVNLRSSRNGGTQSTYNELTFGSYYMCFIMEKWQSGNATVLKTDVT